MFIHSRHQHGAVKMCTFVWKPLYLFRLFFFQINFSWTAYFVLCFEHVSAKKTIFHLKYVWVKLGCLLLQVCKASWCGAVKCDNRLMFAVLPPHQHGGVAWSPRGGELSVLSAPRAIAPPERTMCFYRKTIIQCVTNYRNEYTRFYKEEKQTFQCVIILYSVAMCNIH